MEQSYTKELNQVLKFKDTLKPVTMNLDQDTLERLVQLQRIINLNLLSVSFLCFQLDNKKVVNTVLQLTHNKNEELILEERANPLMRLCLKYNPKFFANLLGYCTVILPQKNKVQTEESMEWFYSMLNDNIESTEIMLETLHGIAWDVHHTWIVILHRIFVLNNLKKDLLKLLARQCVTYGYYDIIVSFMQKIDGYKSYVYMADSDLKLLERHIMNKDYFETFDSLYSTELYPARPPDRCNLTFPLPVGTSLINIFPDHIKKELPRGKDATKWYKESFEKEYLKGNIHSYRELKEEGVNISLKELTKKMHFLNNITGRLVLLNNYNINNRDVFLKSILSLKSSHYVGGLRKNLYPDYATMYALLAIPYMNYNQLEETRTIVLKTINEYRPREGMEDINKRALYNYIVAKRDKKLK